METLVNGVIVTEAAVLSLLIGLGITWMLMRALFRSMPVRLVVNRQDVTQRRDAA